MKRFIGFFIGFLVLFLNISPVISSETPINFDTLEVVSSIIVRGGLVGEPVAKELTRGDVTRTTYDIKFKVADVVKNESEIKLTVGEVATFNILSDKVKDLVAGQEYMLFLKQFYFGPLGFVAGDNSIFKIEKDQATGELMMMNKYRNKGLMRGIKVEIPTTIKKEGLSGKSRSEITRQLQGPLPVQGVVDVVREIRKIRPVAPVRVKPIKKEDVKVPVPIPVKREAVKKEDVSTPVKREVEKIKELEVVKEEPKVKIEEEMPKLEVGGSVTEGEE